MALYGIYFVGWGNKDWMASVSDSESDPTKLLIEYRFRYYDPASLDVFDTLDEKNWVRGVVPKDEGVAYVCRKIYELQLAVAALAPEPPMIVDGIEQLDGDMKAFERQAKQKPWCHMRVCGSKEEADALLKDATKRAFN